MRENKRDHADASGIGGVIHIVRLVIHHRKVLHKHVYRRPIKKRDILSWVGIGYNGEDGGQVGLAMVVSDSVWLYCTTNVSLDA